MKQRKLKTQWMLITTTITFSTILIFSLIIIFYLSSALRHNEVSEAERSSNDINNLFQSQHIKDITPLDLNASLGNFQKLFCLMITANKLSKHQMTIPLSILQL